MSKTYRIERKNVIFEMDHDAVGALLKSEEMKRCLLQTAQEVADSAGEGYKAVEMATRVIVVPGTPEAEQDNYENNTLLKETS